MMGNKIAIYGAGGFGRELACMINALNLIEPTWDFIGFFDDGIEKGYSNRYGKVLGNIDDLNGVSEKLAVAISIAAPEVIQKIVFKVSNPNVYYPNLIAPNAIWFDQTSITIGKGNLIFYGCRVSCDVNIGDFNILNGSVSLGHDVNLGDFNVLGPSVRISGNVSVGNGNFFGVGSIILQGKNIGNRTRIGANSVVIRNTKDDSLYIGNPAKLLSI